MWSFLADTRPATLFNVLDGFWHLFEYCLHKLVQNCSELFQVVPIFESVTGENHCIHG